MERICSQNVILVGVVDNFCLVCDTYLSSEQDINAHIVNPVHHNQLEAIPYVVEYKNDGIKKIKNKYFCEMCNKLLTALPRVQLHISEQTHIYNKNVNCLKRVGNSVIAFGKVVISDQSWHGLNNNSCTTCNMEYENEETHKNQSTHILNVIQTLIEINDDQNIYRRIDEVSYHCLTCNMVLELNSLKTHFDGDYHKKLYQACCNAYNKTPFDTQAENVPVLREKSKDQDINKTPDCTQAENMPDLGEKFKEQDINKTPDGTQPENVPVLREKSKDQDINKSPDGTQAENVPVLSEKSEDQDINKTPDGTQPENVPVLKEKSKDQDINKTPDCTQPENVPVLSEKSKDQDIRDFDIKEKLNEINKDTAKEAPKNDQVLQKVQNNKGKKKKKIKADIFNQKSTNYTNKSQENVIKSGHVYVKNEEDKIVESLGCENYVTHDEMGNCWCILCDWTFHPTKNSMHLKERHHRFLLKLHKRRLQKNINNISDQKTQSLDSGGILEKQNELEVQEEMPNGNAGDILENLNVLQNDQEETLDSDSDDFLEKLDRFQKVDFKIDFELNIAYCKKCKTHMELVSKTIESHILEHQKKPVEKKEKPNAFDSLTNKVSDTKNSLFTSPVFINRDSEGNKNETTSSNMKSVLKHNDDVDLEEKNEPSSNKSSVLKCDEDIDKENKNETSHTKNSVLKFVEEKNRSGTSSSKKSVLKCNDDVDDKNKNVKEYKSNEEYKSSNVVQVSVSLKIKKPKTVNLTKVPVKDFLQNTLLTLKHPKSKSVIINNRYCMNYCSLLFIVHLKADTHRCIVCDEDFQVSLLHHHCNSSRHFKAFIESLVVVNDDSEFIREFREGCFHCGFCNTVVNSWENMEEHLKSPAHKECKNLTTWYREMYQSRVEKDDYENILCDDNFIDEIIKYHF